MHFRLCKSIFQSTYLGSSVRIFQVHTYPVVVVCLRVVWLNCVHSQYLRSSMHVDVKSGNTQFPLQKSKQIQYDPLMMQQKEACRKHPCVLPKKVAFLVWVPNSALIGWWVLPAYFLHASYMLLACFLHASLHASCMLPACFLHASWMLPECFLLYCCYMLQCIPKSLLQS